MRYEHQRWQKYGAFSATYAIDILKQRVKGQLLLSSPLTTDKEN